MAEKINKNYKYKPLKALQKEEIVQGIASCDTAILSRAITLLESVKKEDKAIIYDAIKSIPKPEKPSFKIGITGSPGVGKSTFIETFGKYLGEKNYKVAVLAIDPSSSVTGGSILGDKTRMEQLSNLPNIYIRPTPSKGELGGVANQSFETILLCEKAGFDIILVETVGVGQSETHVKALVDFFLLLILPGAGDELQGIKRGIMELADGLLITKADGDNITKAKMAKSNYQNAMHLFPGAKNNWIPKILTCSSLENKGIDVTWDMINSFKEHTEKNGWLAANRQQQRYFWFKEKLDDLIKSDFYEKNNIRDQIKQLKNQIDCGDLDPFNAAMQVFNNYES